LLALSMHKKEIDEGTWEQAKALDVFRI